MFGKIFSILAGLGLIYSFFQPWYKFAGVTDITPADVLNTALSNQYTWENLFKIFTMIGIPALGVFMILTAVFPKLYLSILKLIVAIVLVVVHVGYFYSNILKLQTPFEWARILETSPGFLIFIAAIIIYFLVVIFAIVLSPVKGVSKLLGI